MEIIYENCNSDGYAYAVVAEYKEQNYQIVNNIRYEKRK